MAAQAAASASVAVRTSKCPIVAILSTIVSVDLTASIAETVRAAREAEGLSANALAERSGVSRAMIAEVELPDAAEIAYPADAYAFIHQQIWMLDGSLTILEEDLRHELERGDCLEF